MIDVLKQKIREAELVLIGIGEEWEVKQSDFEKNEMFLEAAERCKKNSPLLPFIEKLFVEVMKSEQIENREKNYHQLADLIKGKNYFLVSLCTDGMVHSVGLDDNRIVEPCGTMRKMQCSGKCSADLYEISPELMQRVRDFVMGNIEKDEIVLPVCPKCGKPLVLNTILAENYAEEGYLEKWKLYTKWLQGTVNKKVCILELGVGMRFPTVIRWPFEKIAFFNQKASFFRVHSKLYQITEEIKDRSLGMQASCEEFFKELCNED